jgi:hypothetical protein
MSAKLVLTFVDKGYRVGSATDPRLKENFGTFLMEKGAGKKNVMNAKNEIKDKYKEIIHR